MRDLRDMTEFYASRGGRVAARMLRRPIAALWPDVSRLHVLGLGHTQPFLSLWEKQARVCIAGEIRTAQSRESRSIHLLASASCLVQENRLPFADLGFDRILLSHALETSTNPPKLLREVWRVLRDDGRLMLMVPNRRGLWAHAEHTPFGHGAPASKAQIARLLAEALFRVENTVGALWLPPGDMRLLLRCGNLVERAGSLVAPQFAGVLLIEAVKDVYAALPTAKRAQRRVLAAVQ
ncbi:class I SAM-dependent methyltransferase [Lichenicoccus sp.]|uniref:class I SAM-dependent methyltransferase n=1 Tax=Lichenicoccus sp. TaxID=2781899 RepID=UPI003D12C802